MNTPVLLITFNRPAYVRQMIDALRAANVSNLYVFKDGPRPNNSADYKASKEIEDIISSIDWGCTVKTNYMQNNLGCGYGPYSAISWAFQYEDELIILEDDCVPTIPFFDFCSEMLEKYRDNPKVRHITGRCPAPESPVFKQYDYIFTQYAPTIGWATWKRTWDDFDMQMRDVEPFIENGGFSNQFASKKEAEFFNRRFYDTKRDPNAVFHIWDFQYGLHSRMNGALAIVPAANLIDYIGVEGTHPTSVDSEIVQLKTSSAFKARICPSEISVIPEYDYNYFCRFIDGDSRLMSRLIRRIKKLIASINVL